MYFAQNKGNINTDNIETNKAILKHLKNKYREQQTLSKLKSPVLKNARQSQETKIAGEKHLLWSHKIHRHEQVREQQILQILVINLKWMVGGQVNPIISIIIDNNNNKNNNNNCSLLILLRIFYDDDYMYLYEDHS